MELGQIFIFTNALILGIRHGVDWDHIAAISDIVGTASATNIDSSGVATFSQNNGLQLSSFYAIGHATIVLILGILALTFATVLPAWIDPLMERAVGATLILLGIWILYSLFSQRNGNQLVIQSRWMLLFSKIQAIKAKNNIAINKPLRYSSAAAFVIGAIHGFGAETGTQVLLIAAVGSSSSHQPGLLLLIAFIIGLLLSNTLVAVLAAIGFNSSAKFKSFFMVTSAITCVFSLMIGIVFITGRSDLLPDLQHWAK